jgi:biotin carboxylase
VTTYSTHSEKGLSTVPHHVLVVGQEAEIPAVLRGIGEQDVQTSLLCRTSVAGRLTDLTGYRRIVVLAVDSPPEDWVAFARTVHERHPVTAVGAFGELDQDHAARVAEALGLPTNSSATVALVHDKALMRERLRAAGVDDTPAEVVDSAAGIAAFAERHGFPLIAKPVRGAGSTHIARVESAADVEPAFRRAGAGKSEWASGSVLVEPLLPGPQISVEAFSEEGRHVVVAMTAKSSEPDHLVELGHVCPAPLDEETTAAVTALVTGMLDALGVAFGPTHTEVVLTPGGPRPIETHLRLAGDQIPALVRDATGVDLQACVARQTLGHRVLDGIRTTLRAGRGTASAIWYAAPDTAGELRSIEGLAEAEALDGVTEVKAVLSPGATTAPLRSTFDRGAYARATGETAKEALDTAADAASRISFVVARRHVVTDTV